MKGIIMEERLILAVEEFMEIIGGEVYVGSRGRGVEIYGGKTGKMEDTGKEEEAEVVTLLRNGHLLSMEEKGLD